MARHTRSELDQFTRGETAQVIARDARDASIVFLPRGGAAEMRAVAKEHFECPIPGCTAPRPLTTRGGSRRDHFSHAQGSGINHGAAGESLNHLQAKHALAEWAARSAGRFSGTVEVSEEEWVPGIRRRPDVLVRFPDGQQIAIEVEYKAITEADYLAKCSDYAARGIVPSYVFGHTNRYFRRVGDGVMLTPVTKRIAHEGRAVLFINPVDRTVATVYEVGASVKDAVRRLDKWQWRDADRHVGEMRRPTVYLDEARPVYLVAIDSLDDCRLDPRHGIISPTWQHIRNEHRIVTQERDRRMATDAEVAERDRRETEEAERAAAEEAARRERIVREAQDASARRGEQQRRRERLDELLAANRKRLTGEPDNPPALIPVPPPAAASSRPVAESEAVRLCPRCGLKVDPILAGHVLC